jgi:hypothetical protein
MSFGDSLRIAFTAGNGRKVEEGQSDNVELVGWTDGIAGVLVLVVVQAGLLVWSGGGLGAEFLRDLGITAYTALAAPFIMFAIVAATLGRTNRLPAAFLYLGLVLAGLQILSAVLSNFGAGSSGFLIGILGAVCYLAAKGILKLSWPVALAVALVAVIGFMGAGMMLFALPSGRLLT